MHREHNMLERALQLYWLLQNTSARADEDITTILALFISLAARILISQKIFETLFFRCESSEVQNLEVSSRKKRFLLKLHAIKLLLYFTLTIVCIAPRRSELISFKE